MSGVFISYRRDDTQALAGRLFDRLTQSFGKEQVFRDIDAIEPGAAFGQVIAERIGACDALVALIGKGWLDAKDVQGRRRLDLPSDFVKAEIAEALAQGKLVIPALVEGAAMPARDALPPELSALADRNAIQIADARFDFDVGRLLSAINQAIAPQGAAPASTAVARRRGLWSWLSERGTQRTLASPTPTVTATQGGIAAGGNVSATASPGGVAVVATGPVTIGITLSEYEEKIKKREQELRQELREEFAATSKSDKARLALLETQLAAAQAQAKSPEQSLQKYKEVLASASQSLERVKPAAPSSELDNARQALARGETAQAERLFEQVLGQDKERAAEAAYQLGQLAESRIDYATAAKYFAEAVKLQPENPQYLNAAGVMAYTLGRYGEAEPLYQQSLAIWKKALGPDHPDVATSLNNLAALYQAQGLYAKAEPLYQQSLAISKKALGPDHPDVATALENYAALLTQLKRDKEAASLRAQAKEIRVRLASK